uniref:Lipase_GDSL domain-containing protein n=1 Tax=Onchocerca volvulus TaxID=6282 RepID=A0A8R1XMN3_ONCVO
MNTYGIGSIRVLLLYLTFFSRFTDTYAYLVNSVNAAKNSMIDRPENASKFIQPLQQQAKQSDKHFKESKIENDHGVHVEKDSSEEEEEKEKKEEIDPSDSDVSEEIDDEMNWNLSPVQLQLHGSVDSEEQQNGTISFIDSSFINRKTFSCPKIKNDFVTGTDTGDLSPEDIEIIAAMGDSLATGTGLWPERDIEFRGAAFPIGGDATIDGLVTIANILHEFNDKLIGVSHGMGTKFQLPYHQLNVAESGASSSSLPSQAKELVKRLKALREVDINNKWTLVIITIGTEEICKVCQAPDYDALLESLLILNEGIQKAFVVLLGPIHVSSSYHRETNLLKSRCACFKEKSDEFMKELNREWIKAFVRLQTHFEQPYIKRRRFGLLALPMLTITSRYPHSLFIPKRPLLNRKGHTYATKWLWNRLMTGPTYNLSLAVLSQDSYYCPSMLCPYFRTPANRHYCRLIRHIDVENENEDSLILAIGRPMRRSRQKLYVTAGIVVLICFFTVLFIGTILYQKSKYERRIRYGKSSDRYKDIEFDLLPAKN